ncbi:immune-associated nucleotide-binding protein 6 [Plakobranchus ocellatus]|uniref:Immune-associated nucleotide-binding protein 6 n=1 Tax=Plakobranchus ocellatus TaxID=259542 RepID=A0AAV4CMR2_9GAST|nr:immune-associated nucleotide-binding protein 6 [Plakobranchus ocellatus]
MSCCKISRVAIYRWCIINSKEVATKQTEQQRKMARNSSGMFVMKAGAPDDEKMMEVGTDHSFRTPKMRAHTSNGKNLEEKHSATKEKPSAETDVAPNIQASASAQDSSTPDLDLLLIGKSGVGKSATGNSILGRKVFKSSASLNSETDKISADVAKVKGQIIKVVDGPGVGDTRMDTQDGIHLFMDSIQHAMITNPLGYHALLLVLRFGTRFTKEDEDTVVLLKKVFGNDFVKNYCIIVMTCGDMFKYEEEDTGINFEGWVQEQRGKMADLVKECENRIVLFDNVTKVNEEKSAQIDKLLEAVGRLNNNGKRYTDDNFQSAMDAREKLIVESKEPIARDATMQAITLLMQELSDIRGQGAASEDVAATVSTMNDLERLLKNAEALKADVISQDKGTGALKDLIQSVETVEKSIQSSLGLYQQMAESRRQQQQSECEYEKRSQEIQQEMQNVKDEEARLKLSRENERLKMENEKLRMEKQKEMVKHREEYGSLWVNYQDCQLTIAHYKSKRENFLVSNMRKAWKNFANFVSRTFFP